MREIKFRGQDDQRHWHYGSLVIYNDGTFAIAENDPTWTDDGYHNDDFDLIKVRQETVGESTGLLDKNGKEVYEGDIMDDGDGGRCYVVYDTEQAAFGYTYYPAQIRNVHLFSPFELSYMKVIGNIYDNPVIAK